MKFDLRNKEFKEFFISEISQSFYFPEVAKIFSVLAKEDITDKDLMKFYCEFNKLTETLPYYNYLFKKSLFNYKIQRLSNDELIKFKNIIYKEAIQDACVFYEYYGGLFEFKKLSYDQLIQFFDTKDACVIINRFLDEV